MFTSQPATDDPVTMNAVEIEEAISDLALQSFNAQEFPFLLLAAFGNKDTALKRLRAGNNNTSDVPGGALVGGTSNGRVGVSCSFWRR